MYNSRLQPPNSKRVYHSNCSPLLPCLSVKMWQAHLAGRELRGPRTQHPCIEANQVAHIDRPPEGDSIHLPCASEREGSRSQTSKPPHAPERRKAAWHACPVMVHTMPCSANRKAAEPTGQRAAAGKEVGSGVSQLEGTPAGMQAGRSLTTAGGCPASLVKTEPCQGSDGCAVHPCRRLPAHFEPCCQQAFSSASCSAT